MLFLKMKVSIHNPDDYEFSLVDTKGVNFDFNPDEFFHSAEKKLLDDPNIQYFNGNCFKFAPNLIMDSHAFQFDYLNKEKGKMIRSYLFSIPYDSVDKVTLFAFSFSNSKELLNVSIADTDKTTHQIFEELKEQAYKHSTISVEDFRMLKKKSNVPNLLSTIYLQYKSNSTNDIVRRYTLRIENFSQNLNK